jgi:hypothetical protein
LDLGSTRRDTIGDKPVITTTLSLTGTMHIGAMATIAGGKREQHNNSINRTEISYMKITYKNPVVTFALMGAAFLTTGYLCEARQTTVYGHNAITLSDAGPAIAGTWQMSWTNKNGENKQGTLRIEQNGSTLGGTLSGDRGTFPITGALQGDHVSFTARAFGRQLSFSGTVKGNNMHGMTQQQAAWSATRS